MTSNNDQPASDDAVTTTGLTRVTFNATGRAVAALDALTAAVGENRTDVINATLRMAATLLTLAHPDGTLHILAPDGTTHVVHMP